MRVNACFAYLFVWTFGDFFFRATSPPPELKIIENNYYRSLPINSVYKIGHYTALLYEHSIDDKKLIYIFLDVFIHHTLPTCTVHMLLLYCVKKTVRFSNNHIKYETYGNKWFSFFFNQIYTKTILSIFIHTHVYIYICIHISYKRIFVRVFVFFSITYCNTGTYIWIVLFVVFCAVFIFQ